MSKTLGIVSIKPRNSNEVTHQLLLSEFHALCLVEKLTQSISKMRRDKKSRLAINVFAVNNPFTYNDDSPTVSVLK